MASDRDVFIRIPADTTTEQAEAHAGITVALGSLQMQLVVHGAQVSFLVTVYYK